MVSGKAVLEDYMNEDRFKRYRQSSSRLKDNHKHMIKLWTHIDNKSFYTLPFPNQIATIWDYDFSSF